MLVHSKDKLFPFSQSSRRGMTFGIWVSSISRIMSSFSTNKRQLLMCLHLSTSKRQLIMCLHPLTTKWQLIMHLHPVMNKRQLIMCLHHLTTTWQLIMCLHPLTTTWQLTSFRSLKIHHMLAFFGSFFLSTNHGQRFASPLTHTWLIESESAHFIL